VSSAGVSALKLPHLPLPASFGFCGHIPLFRFGAEPDETDDSGELDSDYAAVRPSSAIKFATTVVIVLRGVRHSHPQCFPHFRIARLRGQVSNWATTDIESGGISPADYPEEGFPQAVAA